MRRSRPARGGFFGGLGQHGFAPPPEVHFGAVLDQARGHPACRDPFRRR